MTRVFRSGTFDAACQCSNHVGYTAMSLMSRRAAMMLSVSFGPVSLFLSAIGINGVFAYLVTLRSREVSIRIASGSTSRGAFRLVLREGLWLVESGLIVGLAGT